MIDFDFNKFCYGCTACESKCPVNAINMIYNDEGFIIPSVNVNLCISCGLCDEICIAKNHERNNIKTQEFYGGYYLDDKTVNSASGGIFYGIATNFLKKGGYVSGAILDENLNVKHILTNQYEEMLKMQNSKYVQSDLGNIFMEIKNKINEKNAVLFCGTPCQVASVKKLIKSELLYTISVICEGVPSVLIWEKRKKEVEKKYKKKLTNVFFRNKVNNQYVPSISYYFESGDIVNLSTWYEDPYMMAFYKKMSLRNVCYNCNYKFGNINSDLIIGDFWGASNSIKNKLNKHALSCVIVNNSNGKLLISDHNFKFIQTSLKEIEKENKPLKEPVEVFKRRSDYFEDIKKFSLFFSYLRNYPFNKFKFLVKYCLYKINGGRYE